MKKFFNLISEAMLGGLIIGVTVLAIGVVFGFFLYLGGMFAGLFSQYFAVMYLALLVSALSLWKIWGSK